MKCARCKTDVAFFDGLITLKGFRYKACGSLPEKARLPVSPGIRRTALLSLVVVLSIGGLYTAWRHLPMGFGVLGTNMPSKDEVERAIASADGLYPLIFASYSAYSAYEGEMSVWANGQWHYGAVEVAGVSSVSVWTTGEAHRALNESAPFVAKATVAARLRKVDKRGELLPPVAIAVTDEFMLFKNDKGKWGASLNHMLPGIY